MGFDVLDLVQWFVVAFSAFILAYFVALNANYTLLLILGWREISDYVRRRPFRDYPSIAESELSMAVSILVPAYNEQRVIVQSVTSLLGIHYRHFEIVVINDGSNDDTLEELVQEFDLVPVERVPRAGLESEPLRAVYVSATDDRLLVVDKEHGGKADALNCGLRFARYPLFCSVDSDTMLEEDALTRLVWQFQLRPETVCCGGIVRIVNGSSVDGSKVTLVQTPKRLLANLQIVEYLRAFLVGRTGWSRLGAVLVISGAFGMFRRQVVIDAGAYDTTTVGEDVELVVRLHRYCREQGRRYRISFIADPICWTEAPSSLKVLTSQRDRWQRGLMEAMWCHRKMIGRRRYGLIGLFGMPYLLLFETLGPLIELLGYAVITLALVLGWVQPPLALAFFALAFSSGLIFSLGALRVEERAFQRYRRWRCLGRLLLAAVIENFGYRQFLTCVRVRALFRSRRRGHWGDVRRVGYTMHAPTGKPTMPDSVGVRIH
jgi:cellulose synthase/poly-beta-1,6-N-acetylglucosamine synthase-like glycosyltransferase